MPISIPGTSILDDFNRANVGPPPSANWTTGILASNGLKVSSNTCISNAINSDGYWNASTFGPDCEVYTTITTYSSICRMFLRITTPGAGTADGYLALASNGTPTIYRVDNGSLTELNSSSSVIATGDVILFRILGSNLYLYRKPSGSSFSVIVTANDSTYNGAGYIGIGDQGSASVMDDFGGGNLPTPTLENESYNNFPPYRI